MTSVISRGGALAVLGSSLAAFAPQPVWAATQKLRVGKSVLEVFGYIPLDVGMKYGFFDREGLEIEEINFTGGSKLTQAFTAGAVDIGLSSGPEMAFIAKGAPEIAVGSITNSPAFMAIVVSANSAVRSLDDLKGKKFGVTTVGSLTSWLVDELNRVKGWTTDADRAVSIAIGGEPAAQLSAFKTGQIDASITSPGGGYQLEEAKVGRLLIDVSSYVKDLQLFTIFASNAIVQQNPDAVRRFLGGWYKTVAYMKTHKAETVAITASTIGYSVPASQRMYDLLISRFSTDGKFSPRGLDKLFASFADLKVMDKSTDTSKLYTDKFLPKA
jgi:NitT/TauT family transport system substrate-binding protein